MIKNITNRFFQLKSPLFVLMAGTIFSNAIPLLIQPILTRLISPEQLGIYNLAISLANLIVPIASLRLYQLIVTVKDDCEAERLTKVSVNTVGLVSLVYLVIMLLLYQINESYRAIGKSVWLIPIIVALDGLFFVLTSYFNRYQNYKKMAESDMSRGSFRGLFQILLAVLKFGSFGQILSHVISPLPCLIFGTRSIDLKKYNRNWVGIKETIQTFKQYKNQIVYTVPSQFINSFSYTIILLSITSLYSPVQVGYYSISVKLLGIPLVLVSANVARIYLQRMSDCLNSSGDINRLFKKILIFLFVGSLVMFAIIAIFAPITSEFIFGNGYKEAGIYISILSVMFLFRFVTTSIAGSYVIFGKQKREIIFQIFLIFAGGMSHLLSQLFELNIFQYLMSVTVSYSIVYLSMMIDITRLIKQEGKKYEESNQKYF